MEYQEFIQTVRDNLQVAAGNDTRVITTKLMRNNCNNIDTISVYIEGSNLSPAIHMDQLYKMYQSGYSIENIVSSIWDFILQFQPKNYDISFYCDYNLVKDRVTFRLLNYSANREMLVSVPHRRLLDLAVVYYCPLEDKSFGENPCILIKNSHLEMWGIQKDELNNDAMRNTARLLPYEFKNIDEIINGATYEIDYAEENIALFILSNTDHYFGASALLYPNVLKEIRAKLGRDYYIMPCSVNECMILPYAEEIDPKALRQIVYEVNTESIALEEILGYSIYFYGSREERLEIAAEGI